MTKTITTTTTLAVLLFGIPAADAAKCSLKGNWDAYLTLSHLDDSESERVPWPQTGATCSFAIDGSGTIVNPGIRCDGVFLSQDVEIYVEGFDLKLDRNCRIIDAAFMFFELQSEIIQTQDQYQCQPSGTMMRSGLAVHGLLACGDVPQPFTMVRR
jgi:hypothetical protein